MKTLIIVTGPTASGKTDLAIEIAESLDTEIVSADSRQIFRGIPIGTAVPDDSQLARVKHHFIQTLDLNEYYSAAMYEEQALKVLDAIWATRDYAVMCGGSMMYIDAVTNGIDPLPP
ncbi:MAG: tRNA (adenosine(37)-N6)-dimethylallyltransferase MiaA, partial [Duncaniella sp.]|nr:tRNA (adenosine(37)-N6)-dimethylallyltransferase MiaA [Duncaniella sp.]